MIGIIIGLLISTLIFSILAYFKSTIENKMEIITKQIESKGPRPSGAIFIPSDEIIEARKEIIAQNDAEGKDTKLSDLL